MLLRSSSATACWIRNKREEELWRDAVPEEQLVRILAKLDQRRSQERDRVIGPAAQVPAQQPDVHHVFACGHARKLRERGMSSRPRPR